MGQNLPHPLSAQHSRCSERPPPLSPAQSQAAQEQSGYARPPEQHRWAPESAAGGRKAARCSVPAPLVAAYLPHGNGTHRAHTKLSRLPVLKTVPRPCLHSFPSPNRNSSVSSLTCCLPSRPEAQDKWGCGHHLCQSCSLRGLEQSNALRHSQETVITFWKNPP